jgi:hypothetical protein
MRLSVPHPKWIERHGDGHQEYLFECPGCKQMHRVIVKWGSKSGRTEPEWSFNGSLDRPTFSPSLLVQWNSPDKNFVCHSFIRDGQIQFLNDCTHALAGKTVDLPEVTE